MDPLDFIATQHHWQVACHAATPNNPKADQPKARPGRKFCPACNATHPGEDFARNKAAADGRYRICKKAEAEWRRQRAAAIAAGARRVIRKGSPGYVEPKPEPAKAAKPVPSKRTRKTAPKR